MISRTRDRGRRGDQNLGEVGSTGKIPGRDDDERGHAQRTVDLVDLVARSLPDR